jgi:hypothetical protein
VDCFYVRQWRDVTSRFQDELSAFEAETQRVIRFVYENNWGTECGVIVAEVPLFEAFVKGSTLSNVLSGIWDINLCAVNSREVCNSI